MYSTLRFPSHHGVKICDCKKKGIYNCRCPRRYSDTDARWGWDRYNEDYFYDDTPFSATAFNGPYDLPIYLKIAQATRYDSILTIFDLNEVRKLYPSIAFKNLIADGAMDNYATYRLLHKWNMIPFITLDSTARIVYIKPYPGILSFDDDNPICMGGIPSQRDGFSFPKGIKYRYWFDYQDYHGIEKPCSFSNSSYGRTIYIKPDYDLMLFPPVPRNT
jgi:hypothetical protein